MKYESRSARAVNETEIIKRRYLPLRSVNPRSNKAAGGDGEESGKEERQERQRRTSRYHLLPRWNGRRERGNGERFSPDDFLITRSQFRVFAPDVNAISRGTRPADDWREGRKASAERRCRNDPGFMLSSREDSREARTCRGNWIGGKEKRHVKVVPADIYRYAR